MVIAGLFRARRATCIELSPRRLNRRGFRSMPMRFAAENEVVMEAPVLIVVYPSALLGWEVLAPACADPQCFDDRAAAVEFARSLAASTQPCRIQIEDWYGHIECEWTVAAAQAATT